MCFLLKLVPHQRVSVKFIPVFEEDEQKNFEKEIITYDVSRSLDHNIRSDVYCWCDSYTLAAACHGMIHRFYVIELNINREATFSIWCSLLLYSYLDYGFEFINKTVHSLYFANNKVKRCYIFRNVLFQKYISFIKHYFL